MGYLFSNEERGLIMHIINTKNKNVHICKFYSEIELKNGGMESEQQTETMLNNRVQGLEDKINNVLEQVAPMIIKKAKYRGRPKWVTPYLLLRMKERVQSRLKANKSRSMDDETHARMIRNQVIQRKKQKR